MNDQSETERSSTSSHWFGLDRLRLGGDDQAIDITIGSESHWDRSHLRRLRQSGDLPGMVPVIDSDFSADGKPFAITPVVDAPSLRSLVEDGLEWTSGAGITEAAARAAHEAHLRGLFHGALAPEDVFLLGKDVAISGVGLGLGGTPPNDRLDWVAPEVRDGAEPTERSDVYSLGKILEASLGDALETVPRSIRRLIMWSSSDTPEARPPSAMEFASILAEGLGDDRETYGPAFIPTAGSSELASQASSAVSNHTPSEVAQSTASAAGLGMAGAGAAAAAFLGHDDPDLADEGFSLSEAEFGDADPGIDLDSADADIELEEVPEPADLTIDPGADLIEAPYDAYDGGALEQNDEEAQAYASPVAAETVDLEETYLPRKRNRAGLVVAAVLGLGLALIAWGILRSGDDDLSVADGTETSESADTTPSSVEGEETAAPAPSSSVGSTTDSENSSSQDSEGEGTATTAQQSTSQTTEAPATTELPATSASTAAADGSESESSESDGSGSEDNATSVAIKPADPGDMAATAEGPIAMGDAGIQVLHGLPGVEADVYVNGEAIATGFTAGTIAGPIAMEAGDYEVVLYEATDLAPANAGDRTDEPLMTQMVPVGASAASVVAHLDESGQMAISPFLEQLSPVDPGQGRIMIRHLMATGEADAAVAGEPVGSLAPGEEAAVEVDAGSVLVEILGTDGAVLATATVPVDDGELVSLTAIGSPGDDSAELVIQRYTGLSTAPVAVQTGDSGLLGLGDDNTGQLVAYGLMAVLALSGGVVALRRQRSVW